MDSEHHNNHSLDSHEPHEEKKRKFRLKLKPKDIRVNRRLLKILIISILIIGVVFLVYGYLDTRNELNKAKNPQETAKEETKELVAKISQFLELPANESPTVATISDEDRLSTQPFFKNAQNGDKVLVYTNSEMAILYRPSTGKVVQYAPVSLSGN